MISEFRPKNIMIHTFWEKKLQNSGMAHFSEFDGKKLFNLVNASRPVFNFYCLLIFGPKFN